MAGPSQSVREERLGKAVWPLGDIKKSKATVGETRNWYLPDAINCPKYQGLPLFFLTANSDYRSYEDKYTISSKNLQELQTMTCLVWVLSDPA